jgi:hypothetical protein
MRVLPNLPLDEVVGDETPQHFLHGVAEDEEKTFLVLQLFLFPDPLSVQINRPLPENQTENYIVCSFILRLIGNEVS